MGLAVNKNNQKIAAIHNMIWNIMKRNKTAASMIQKKKNLDSRRSRMEKACTLNRFRFLRRVHPVPCTAPHALRIHHEYEMSMYCSTIIHHRIVVIKVEWLRVQTARQRYHIIYDCSLSTQSFTFTSGLCFNKTSHEESLTILLFALAEADSQ